MTKTKFLTVLSLVLLLINLFLIAWMAYHKPPHPPSGEGPKDYIIAQLGLDEHQIDRYETLIAAHREQQQVLNQSIQNTRQKIYELLTKEERNNEEEVLIVKLGELKAQVERLNWEHFSDLKAICTAEQQAKFEQLALELAKLMRPRMPIKPKK